MGPAATPWRPVGGVVAVVNPRGALGEFATRGQESHMRQHRELLLAILLVCLVVLVSPLSAPSQTAPSAPSQTVPSAPSQTVPSAPSQTVPSAPSQTVPTSQSTSSATDTAPAAFPSRGAPALAPALTAKDIQGLDVFGSDGQQVGKIAKVNVTDGTVRDVEVQSVGFLGFFSKTYLLPADKLSKKGGRVELSMTSGQARQFIK